MADADGSVAQSIVSDALHGVALYISTVWLARWEVDQAFGWAAAAVAVVALSLFQHADAWLAKPTQPGAAYVALERRMLAAATQIATYLVVQFTLGRALVWTTTHLRSQDQWLIAVLVAACATKVISHAPALAQPLMASIAFAVSINAAALLLPVIERSPHEYVVLGTLVVSVALWRLAEAKITRVLRMLGVPASWTAQVRQIHAFLTVQLALSVYERQVFAPARASVLTGVTAHVVLVVGLAASMERYTAFGENGGDDILHYAALYYSTYLVRRVSRAETLGLVVGLAAAWAVMEGGARAAPTFAWLPWAAGARVTGVTRRVAALGLRIVASLTVHVVVAVTAEYATQRLRTFDLIVADAAIVLAMVSVVDFREVAPLKPQLDDKTNTVVGRRGVEAAGETDAAAAGEAVARGQ